MKEKILVVDDDKSMVNMIKDVLEMEGYAFFGSVCSCGVSLLSIPIECLRA